MESIASFFGSLEFSTSAYFWIAAALVLLLIFLPWLGRKRGLTLDLAFWKKDINFKSKRVLVMSVPVVIASVLMAGVLANPQQISKPVTYIYGYPVMLVVDVSASMGIGSWEGTPYGYSQEIFQSLITRRGDINFGLLMYSTDNYIARYFINKDELFVDTLEQLKDLAWISIGTVIPEALTRARVFMDEKIKGGDKTVVLITDLDVPTSEWLKIVTELTKLSLSGVNTYVISPGEFLQAAIKSGKDFTGIKAISMEDKDAIEQMCNDITKTQMSIIREDEKIVKKSAIQYLVWPALALIVLCLVLGETRFRKIP